MLDMTIPISGFMLLIILIVFVLLFFTVLVLTMFAIRIPFFKAQLKSALRKRPLAMIHGINRTIELFDAKRAGKDNQMNYLELPKRYGTMFEPRSEYSESYDGVPMYHYFSKAAGSLSPAEAKAVEDYKQVVSEMGIDPNNTAVIDVLFHKDLDIEDTYEESLVNYVKNKLPVPIEAPVKYEDMTKEQKQEVNELKAELDNVDNELEELKKDRKSIIHQLDNHYGLLDKYGERINTLKDVKNRLMNMVIKDGHFVFPKLHNIVHAQSNITSSGLTEAISITTAEQQALNTGEDKKDRLTILIGAGMLVFFSCLGVYVLTM